MSYLKAVDLWKVSSISFGNGTEERSLGTQTGNLNSTWNSNRKNRMIKGFNSIKIPLAVEISDVRTDKHFSVSYS